MGFVICRRWLDLGRRSCVVSRPAVSVVCGVTFDKGWCLLFVPVSGAWCVLCYQITICCLCYVKMRRCALCDVIKLYQINCVKIDRGDNDTPLPWWGSGNHLLIIISFFSGLSPLPSQALSFVPLPVEVWVGFEFGYPDSSGWAQSRFGSAFSFTFI